MKPQASVIIPVYNVSKYLNRSIASILNQTLSNIEIICVDDCSTDNSLKILNEFAEKYIILRFLPDKETFLNILFSKTIEDETTITSSNCFLVVSFLTSGCSGAKTTYETPKIVSARVVKTLSSSSPFSALNTISPPTDLPIQLR